MFLGSGDVPFADVIRAPAGIDSSNAGNSTQVVPKGVNLGRFFISGVVMGVNGKRVGFIIHGFGDEAAYCDVAIEVREIVLVTEQFSE
jgi:hypothetical protein